MIRRFTLLLAIAACGLSAQTKKILVMGAGPDIKEYQSVSPKANVIPVTRENVMKEIVDTADRTHIHDEWTKEKFLTGKYKASELYGGPPLSPELQKEYDAFVKKRLAELNK